MDVLEVTPLVFQTKLKIKARSRRHVESYTSNVFIYIYIYSKKNIHARSNPKWSSSVFLIFLMNFFSFYKTPNKSNPKVRIFSHGPRLHPHGGRMQGLVIPDLPSGELTWWKFRCGKILGEESPLGVIFLDEKKFSFFSDSKMFFQLVWKAIPHRFFAGSFFGRFLEMIFINWVAWKNYKKSGLLQRLSMASGFFFAGVWTLSISCV